MEGYGGTYAVYGTGASSYGVYGSGTSGGVYGTGTIGVFGTGPQYGVEGSGSGAGNGVQGIAAGTGDGVYGSGTYGVYGIGSTYDFYGGGGEHAQSGSWTNSSDRNLKENFTQLDNQTILDKIIELPVTEWNYKKDKNALHIGPMAQDFYSIFGLNGDDNLSISTIDPAGVALVGIKALNENIDKETGVQQGEIDAIQGQVKKLID